MSHEHGIRNGDFACTGVVLPVVQCTWYTWCIGNTRISYSYIYHKMKQHEIRTVRSYNTEACRKGSRRNATVTALI